MERFVQILSTRRVKFLKLHRLEATKCLSKSVASKVYPKCEDNCQKIFETKHCRIFLTPVPDQLPPKAELLQWPSNWRLLFTIQLSKMQNQTFTLCWKKENSNNYVFYQENFPFNTASIGEHQESPESNFFCNTIHAFEAINVVGVCNEATLFSNILFSAQLSNCERREHVTFRCV